MFALLQAGPQSTDTMMKVVIDQMLLKTNFMSVGSINNRQRKGCSTSSSILFYLTIRQ